jgi:ArsR family transcriptional regulator
MSDVPGIFKALSDETRLRIVSLLQDGELCVCDIVAALGTSQPRASFHLAVLKEAGLIKDRKVGRWTHYNLKGADLFRRFLLLSVAERYESPLAAEDRQRLAEFLKQKAATPAGEEGAGRACCA